MDGIVEEESTAKSPEDKWVTEQLKFAYGKWYDDVVNKNYIKPVRCQRSDGVGPSGESFVDYFLSIRPDYKKEDIIFNMHDNVTGYTNFIVTGRRKFGTDTQVLFPHCFQINPKRIKNNLISDMPYNQKNNKLIWRGATTNVAFSDGFRWSRYDIVKKFYGKYPNIDIAFSHITQNYQKARPDVKELLAPGINSAGYLKSKFILCLEGNDVCSGFNWQLPSNSLCLHTYPFCSESSIFLGLEPWKQFVPVKGDGSDLEEKYQWCLSHEEECLKIIENAHEHMKYFLNEETYIKYIEGIINLYPTFS